jgi:hypothetical protein
MVANPRSICHDQIFPLKFLALLPLSLCHPLLAAGLELASPFVDQAVLQREMRVPDDE